jgi:uncharacterized membrane protein
MGRHDNNFWKGFSVGTLAGAGGSVASMLIYNLVSGRRDNRVVQLEKSIQIGAAVPDVFRAWSDLENLSSTSPIIQEVRVRGTRSHWRVAPDGKVTEFEAELEQLIPNEAIGWKSVSGPKHTGRITFSPIGQDTLVHVRMNYAPPGRLLATVAGPSVRERLEFAIDRALRDFKESLERKHSSGPRRATGTFGGDLSAREITAAAERPNPVDYTRPPEIKS